MSARAFVAGSERPCVRCGAMFVAGVYARTCPKKECRGRNRPALPPRPRKYAFTPEMDAYLRRHYRRGALRAITAHFGWPPQAKSSVQRRASALGLIAQRGHEGRRWSPEEITYIEEHAGQKTCDDIAAKLQRSPFAVINKARELSVSLAVRDGYTIQALVSCFGESEQVVTRWLALGLFGRVRYLSGRHERTSPREPVCLTEAQVHTFAREHRREYSLQRVEPAWFLDLIFDQRRVEGKGRKVA